MPRVFCPFLCICINFVLVHLKITLIYPPDFGFEVSRTCLIPWCLSFSSHDFEVWKITSGLCCIPSETEPLLSVWCRAWFTATFPFSTCVITSLCEVCGWHSKKLFKGWRKMDAQHFKMKFKMGNKSRAEGGKRDECIRYSDHCCW